MATPAPSTSSLTFLQPLTTHLAYLAPLALAVVNIINVIVSTKWNADTVALINALLAAVGLGSIHINSL